MKTTKCRRRRRMMPKPDVPVLMDAKLALQCRTWLKLHAMIERQCQGKLKRKEKRWSHWQQVYAAQWLEGEALEKIGRRLLTLYNSQYPATKYVR